MKYTFKGRFVTVEAETDADNRKLMAIGTEKAPRKANKAQKKHRKHQFTKVCAGCGRPCKGNKGLGVHMAKCGRKPKGKAVRSDGWRDVPVISLASARD